LIVSLLVGTVLPLLKGKALHYTLSGAISLVLSLLTITHLVVYLSYPFLGTVASVGISSQQFAFQQFVCAQLSIGSFDGRIYSSCEGNPVAFIILTFSILFLADFGGFLLGSELRARLVRNLSTLSLYAIPVIGSILVTFATGLFALSVLSAPGAGTTSWYGFPLFWKSELLAAEYGCSTPCVNILWVYFALDVLFFITIGYTILTALLFLRIRQGKKGHA